MEVTFGSFCFIHLKSLVQFVLKWCNIKEEEECAIGLGVEDPLPFALLIWKCNANVNSAGSN